MINKKELLNNLNSHPYFEVLSINSVYPNAKKNLKKKFFNFAKNLGQIRYQNFKKDKIIEIKPNFKKINELKKAKTKIKSVLRYHQTNLGGSIHSDGPQHSTPPKYVIMACEQNSPIGGDTILVDTKKIYEYLRYRKPKIFKTLNKDIYFERRGFNFGNSNVFSKKIFSFKNKRFMFRYLRDYIEEGYKIKKKDISKDTLKAFNYLDKLLISKKFMKKIKLAKGDLILLNNHILAHGRTMFKLEKNFNARKLYRIWIG